MSAALATARPCPLCAAPPTGPFTHWPGGACLPCAMATTTVLHWRSPDEPPRLLVLRQTELRTDAPQRLLPFMLVGGTYLPMDSRPCWAAAWMELALVLLTMEEG